MTTGDLVRTRGDVSTPIIIVVVAIVTLAVAVVNALSRVDEITRAGLAIEAWEPWIWELTSAAFWILVAAPLVFIMRKLRPPKLRWPLALGALIALSVPVCALHLAWFAVSRGAIYQVIGLHYAFDGAVLYEWRKDVLSIAVFAMITFALDHWTAQRALPPLQVLPTSSFRLEIRDGSRKYWLAPEDIERVEAAGNYVELYTVAGAVLHRKTLSTVEAELIDFGFVRVHRSRLVRRGAVIAIAGTPAGDFNATLASGAVVVGSRRYKDRLG